MASEALAPYLREFSGSFFESGFECCNVCCSECCRESCRGCLACRVVDEGWRVPQVDARPWVPQTLPRRRTGLCATTSTLHRYDQRDAPHRRGTCHSTLCPPSSNECLPPCVTISWIPVRSCSQAFLLSPPARGQDARAPRKDFLTKRVRGPTLLVRGRQDVFRTKLKPLGNGRLLHLDKHAVVPSRDGGVFIWRKR